MRLRYVDTGKGEGPVGIYLFAGKIDRLRSAAPFANVARPLKGS